MHQKEEKIKRLIDPIYTIFAVESNKSFSLSYRFLYPDEKEKRYSSLITLLTEQNRKPYYDLESMMRAINEHYAGIWKKRMKQRTLRNYADKRTFKSDGELITLRPISEKEIQELREILTQWRYRPRDISKILAF
jgi:hypothetical protein